MEFFAVKISIILFSPTRLIKAIKKKEETHYWQGKVNGREGLLYSFLELVARFLFNYKYILVANCITREIQCRDL